MNVLIVYGSHYGTTKRYANELAKRTGYFVTNYEEVFEIASYDVIIHFGGLYAGGVLGLTKIGKLLDQTTKELIVVTVGLADPHAKSNVESIQKSVQRQLSKEVYEDASVFHLRGGIDYKKLSIPHRTMMALLVNKVKRVTPEKMTSEMREMIATYNQIVDFVNFDSLLPIIDLLDSMK